MCPRSLELLSSYATNHEDVSRSLFLRVNYVLTFSELLHDRSFSYSAGWKRRLELSGFSLSMIYVYQLLITQVIVFFWNLTPVTLWVTFWVTKHATKIIKIKSYSLSSIFLCMRLCCMSQQIKICIFNWLIYFSWSHHFI